jgi:hypothetical protein
MTFTGVGQHLLHSGCMQPCRQPQLLGMGVWHTHVMIDVCRMATMLACDCMQVDLHLLYFPSEVRATFPCLCSHHQQVAELPGEGPFAVGWEGGGDGGGGRGGGGWESRAW